MHLFCIGLGQALEAQVQTSTGHGHVWPFIWAFIRVAQTDASESWALEFGCDP